MALIKCGRLEKESSGIGGDEQTKIQLVIIRCLAATIEVLHKRNLTRRRGDEKILRAGMGMTNPSSVRLTEGIRTLAQSFLKHVMLSNFSSLTRTEVDDQESPLLGKEQRNTRMLAIKIVDERDRFEKFHEWIYSAELCGYKDRMGAALLRSFYKKADSGERKAIRGANFSVRGKLEKDRIFGNMKKGRQKLTIMKEWWLKLKIVKNRSGDCFIEKENVKCGECIELADLSESKSRRQQMAALEMFSILECSPARRERSSPQVEELQSPPFERPAFLLGERIFAAKMEDADQQSLWLERQAALSELLFAPTRGTDWAKDGRKGLSKEKKGRLKSLMKKREGNSSMTKEKTKVLRGGGHMRNKILWRRCYGRKKRRDLRKNRGGDCVMKERRSFSFERKEKDEQFNWKKERNLRKITIIMVPNKLKEDLGHKRMKMGLKYKGQFVLREEENSIFPKEEIKKKNLFGLATKRENLLTNAN